MCKLTSIDSPWLLKSKYFDSRIRWEEELIGKNSVTPCTKDKINTSITVKKLGLKENESIDHIFGYCLVNDLSEREWQIEKMGQWTKGKSHDTYGPIGPYIVTPDEIDNINNLNLSLDVNGQRMQTGNTSKMIFNVNYIVSYLSKFMSLQPGDLITTGTPPGVGMGKKPQVFLKEGDIVNLSIDNLGEQKARVILL